VRGCDLDLWGSLSPSGDKLPQGQTTPGTNYPRGQEVHEYLLSSECLRTQPELFFDYYRKNLDARKAEPNAAHFKLAEMEKSGRLEGVITQNIDGLHQKAGSRNVQGGKRPLG